MRIDKHKLYAFKQSYGRAGTINMLFAATEDELAKLLGRSVSWHEILGEHSSVPWYEFVGEHSQFEFDFSDDTVSAVNIDEDALKILLEHPHIKIESAEEFLSEIDGNNG